MKNPRIPALTGIKKLHRREGEGTAIVGGFVVECEKKEDLCHTVKSRKVVCCTLDVERESGEKKSFLHSLLFPHRGKKKILWTEKKSDILVLRRMKEKHTHQNGSGGSTNGLGPRRKKG